MGLPSVVAHVCTYNGETILPGFLERYAALDPAPEHTIFVTNNNRDRTLELLKEWDGPKTIVPLWFVPDLIRRAGSEYAGLAIARQVAWDAAKRMGADIIWQLDDDIYFDEPDTLDTYLTWLSDPLVDVLGGTYVRDFPEGRYICAKMMLPGGRVSMIETPVAPLMEPTVVGGGCMLVKRHVFMDPDVYTYPLLGTASEDFGLCLRMRAAGYRIFLDGTVCLAHNIEREYKAWTKRDDMLDFIYDA